MYCRGENTRREVVKSHELHPVAHVQLLVGQTKTSCTGDALTDAYYCFFYKSRTATDQGIILCGEYAAKDFLQLIGHAGLPLFNPLITQSGTRSTGVRGPIHGTSTKWDLTAKQLHNAINLLVVCWSSPPGPALFDIKTKLEKFSFKPPFSSQIKAINTIIGKDVKKRTLSQMISELAQKNSVKTYDFSLLEAVLASEKVDSNFT